MLDDLLRRTFRHEGLGVESGGVPRGDLRVAGLDPATYLVALDEASEGIGIVRIWMRRDGPRLGLIGVRSDWRRRGVARAMLAAV